MHEDDARVQAQCYEIVVQGLLDERRARWFEGMTLTWRPGGESVLAGALPDQAALLALLGRLHDLGLTLVTVRKRASVTRGATHETRPAGR